MAESYEEMVSSGKQITGRQIESLDSISSDRNNSLVLVFK